MTHELIPFIQRSKTPNVYEYQLRERGRWHLHRSLQTKDEAQHRHHQRSFVMLCVLARNEMDEFDRLRRFYAGGKYA
jgi:hypothetical protein